MKNDNPLVSIITVSLNSAKTIRDTVESILKQTYSNIEYILVDGVSKDNTVALVNSYTDRFLAKGYGLKMISEKDRGLYDAMNKGVLMATGDIIGILNSDDFYIDEAVISKVVARMKETQTDCLYADLQYVDREDTSKVVRTWKAGQGQIRFGWIPPHPTTFISKEAYKKIGLYKTDYKISSDYDILYRLIRKEKIAVTYLPEFIVRMRSGGVSTNGLKAIYVGSKEIYITLKENHESFVWLTLFFRLLFKVKQFLVR